MPCFTAFLSNGDTSFRYRSRVVRSYTWDAFSYGATGFLLKHITTNNLLPGELRCKLSNYLGYNKFSKILRRKKREDIKGLQILRC